MLLAFISLMEAVTVLFNFVGLDFKQLIGFIFAPIAFIIGVPWNEAVQAGSLMATKLITNEFVAMLDYQKLAGDLTLRTQGIISVYLVSFANFGTVGIIVGAIKGFSDVQGNKVASVCPTLATRFNTCFNYFSINRWFSIIVFKNDYINPNNFK